MRIHNWFRTIAGALALTAAADTVSAQDFGAPGPGMAPQGYGPPYSTAPGNLYPQGVPQGFDPWPQISPFGMGNLDQDTLLNSNGLWFRDLIYKDRDFYAGVDAIYSFSKGEGNTLVGAPTLPLDPTTNGLLPYFPPPPGGPVTGTGAGTQIPGALYVGNGVYPYPFYFLAAGVPQSTVRNDLFPIRYHNTLGNLDSTGLQVRWGFDDADGVGLMLTGFWLGESSKVFQMGQDSINGYAITPQMTANQNGYFLNPLNGSLPTNNGLRFDLFSTNPLIAGTFGAVGATQKFDILYHIERRQEVAGTNLAYYMNPFFKSPGVMLRPFLGARYMYVDEQFGFRGIDSGFNYDIQGVTGGTTGTATVPSFRPIPTTLVQVYQQFEATLSSTVQTHLAGPEIGLRYDLGGSDDFKIWGATTLGLMANYSNLSLAGNNIGEVELTSFVYGIDMLNEDARFASKANHSRVSPMFEQTLAVDAKIFEALPYVNEIPILNEAIFHFGYTFSAIAHMNRPLDVVNWNGFPIAPTLNNNTQTFLLHKFNFGLEWKY